MDSSTMTEIECPGPGSVGASENSVLKAEKISVVSVVHTDAPITTLCDGKYTLHDLLSLYDMGVKQVAPSDHGRFRATFSLAASHGGVWALCASDAVRALAVFWRTKNPHVDLERAFPKHEADGNYAYVGWFWSDGDHANEVIAHIAKSQPGVEFVAWHDYRLKRKKAHRGELYVLELPKAPVTLAKVLGIGTGKVAANG